MVIKWPTIPMIDQGPVSRLFPLLTTNLLRQPESICNAKGSRGKRAEKERKGARKILGTSNHKKTTTTNKSKFWLMRMHQIEILHSFVPNLWEIYLFDKNSFLPKCRPI